jgi:hypothetical protein
MVVKFQVRFSDWASNWVEATIMTMADIQILLLLDDVQVVGTGNLHNTKDKHQRDTNLLRNRQLQLSNL